MKSDVHIALKGPT